MKGDKGAVSGECHDEEIVSGGSRGGVVESQVNQQKDCHYLGIHGN